MYIERNGEKIELTARELESAFREREHQYMLEDAKRHFCEFAIGYYDYGEEYDEDEYATADADFKNTYGFSIVDAIDERSAYYVLETLVERYADAFDCNIAENDIWQSVCECVLNECKSDRYKVELSIRPINEDDAIEMSIEGEDLVMLKQYAMESIPKTLYAFGCSSGYCEVKMNITCNDEYFDSEPEILVYVDKDFTKAELARGLSLYIHGKSNLSNPAIDYIEIETSNGSVITLDWDSSCWEVDEETGFFGVELLSVGSNNGAFLNGDIIKNSKICAIQVYSNKVVDDPYFAIEKVEVCEDDVIMGVINKPTVKDIFFEN